MKLQALLLFLGLSLLIGGCGAVGKATTPVPNVLQVTRNSAFHQNSFPNLQRTVKNAATVQSLDQAVLALPSFPTGILHCPADFGIDYRLDFFRGNTSVLQAVADPNGCQAVSLSRKDLRWATTTPKFWALLAKALGIPINELVPWKKEPPVPAPAPYAGFIPSAIAFWDTQHGLAVGQGGIQTTTDAGRTWQVSDQNPNPGLNFTSADVTGNNYGWTAVSLNGCQSLNQANCRRQLLSTTNGGQSWQFISHPHIGEPSFATPLLGWAAGTTTASSSTLGPAPVLITSDGGRTWQPLPGPTCQGQGWYLRSLSFSTPTHGFALCVGEATAGSQDKAILTTTDGGKTWKRVAEASFGGSPAKGISLSGYPDGIFFLPDGRGWLWQQRGNLLTTADGGTTWQESNLTQPGFDIEARSVWFLTDTAGFVLLTGDSGSNPFQPVFRLVYTQDGGQSWTTMHTWREEVPFNQ